MIPEESKHVLLQMWWFQWDWRDVQALAKRDRLSVIIWNEDSTGRGTWVGGSRIHHKEREKVAEAEMSS